MILQVILEGLGLGALLVLVCAVGIRKGAVGMAHLYSLAVQRRCWRQLWQYSDRKDPSVSGFFRFLAKVGDNGMKMQIVKIRFGGGQ